MSRWKTELKRFAAWSAAMVVLVICVTVLVGAQEQQTGFKTVTDIGRENLPANPMVYTAYAIVWIVLIGYVFMLWRRLSRVERELRDVSSRLSSGKR